MTDVATMTAVIDIRGRVKADPNVVAGLAASETGRAATVAATRFRGRTEGAATTAIQGRGATLTVAALLA